MLSSLPMDVGQGGALENKKRAAESPRLPLKMGIKKAQYPYIGHCAVKKIRLHLIKWR